MRVKLNTDVQSMFPLLRLTWENPGPVEVDQDKLSPQQMLWINNAVKKGVLSVEGVAPKAEVLPVAPPPPHVAKVPANDSAQKADELVKLPQAALLVELDKETSLAVLKKVLQSELEGKKRKKVVSAAQTKIDILSAVVSATVGAPLDENDIFITDRSLKNLPEVEETFEEERTVSIEQE